VLSRHVSLDEWSCLLRMNLGSPSVTSFLCLHQQTCNCHKVVCKHGCSDQQFEPLATLGETAFHATTTEENRDATLDASAETLSVLEGWTFLIGFLGQLFPASPLRNAHKIDTGVFALLDIVLAEKPSIGTVGLWGIAKCLLVTLKRRLYLRVIGGIPIEYAILSDQAAGTFSDEDFVPEFDRFQDFASLDQVGMGFEDRKELLSVWDLLSIEHSTTRLIDDPLPKATVVIDLFAEGLDGDLGHQIDTTDLFGFFENQARIFHYLPGCAYECAIFWRQLILAISGCHSLDFLHPAPGAARPIGESRYAVRKQIIELPDQPCDDSYAVPQQGAVCWVVNVAFDHGRIDTQFLAIFQAQGDSGFDNDFVDCFKRCRSEPVKGPVKSVMFGNELAVETSESPQGISVCDAFAQFAVMPVLDPHQSERAQHLVCGQPVSPDLGILQAAFKIAAYLLNQVSVLVEKVGDCLQHRLQAYALPEEFEIGKTGLGDRGSCHFLTF
jgi:hypothetical protein